MTYSDKLKDPRWQRRRLEIMQRDDFACRLCGSKDATLHVHHMRYERGADPWEAADRSLVTLCLDCHEFLHTWFIGEELVESFVGAGASRDDLLNIQGLTSGRLWGRRLSREQWAQFIERLGYALEFEGDA